jgi:hypothetical protein
MSVSLSSTLSTTHRRRLDNAQAPAKQSLGVFTSVIVIVCVGALVVTIQAKVGSEPVFFSRFNIFLNSLCVVLASRWTGVGSFANLVRPFVF